MKLTWENFKEEYPDFKGLYVPPEILHDENLSANDKNYLSLLKVYDMKDADRIICLFISPRTLESIKTKLKSNGYIDFGKYHETNAKKAKELTIKLSHKGRKCEWCGRECYILHKHHFPISAKDGGVETVEICPNCHYTFHNIVGR